MKRFVLVLLVALAGAACAADAPKLLWEIGKADGSNAEFAPAPKDYDKFTDDGFFVIGHSDPKRDWPSIHPGPSDSWAGGRAHTFTIVFGVKKAPRKGKCVLRLKLHDTHHDALPNIRVEVNDESFEAPQPEGTNTVAKPFYTMWDFPTSLLRTGNNRIAIVNTEGSWFRYDRIALETPAPVQLAPVANAAKLIAQAHPPPAKIEEVIVVFKTHFDIGYTDMASNVVARYRTTMIDKALEVVDQNRDLPPAQQFAWTIPGWPLHQILDWPEQTPERKARVERALKDGRFVVHALPFTLHTETLELEDLVRGLGHSSRIARRLGLPLPRDAKMTDVPCHAWVMPTLLKRAGVDFLHIGCNSASSSPRVPELFWWEGPDGSRLLTYYSAGGYGSGLMPPRDWPHKTWLALIHTGDNHGPPTPAEVKKLLDQAAKQLPGVKVRIGRLSDFADAVLAEKPKLQVVRGDMPDTWIHGPMCDPLGAKIGRNIRPDIAVTEALGTQLNIWGARQPAAAQTINDAYEQSLLYGEHTWGAALWWLVKYEGGAKFGYGDAWRQVMAKGHFRRHEESWAEHTAYIEKARDLTAPLLDHELRALAQAVGGSGQRIVVFNPLPWKRDGVVSVKADAAIASLKPSDGGDAVPVETVGSELRFIARDVPAMGYRVFAPVKAELPPTKLRADEKTATIESVFFKATLDPASGSIRSLTDKRSGRELVSPGFGQYLYERFDSNSVAAYVSAYVKSRAAWAVDQLGKPALPPTSEVPYRAASPRDCKLSFAQTPVSVSANMTSAARPDLPHSVTTRLILYADAPWADLEITLHDKPADPWPEAGWICLLFNVASPRFRVGRPGAIIDPARDIVAGANHDLYAVTTGAAMLDARNGGVGFCAPDTPLLSLDRPGGWKYDPVFMPRKSSAYVNLFNNQWTTNFRFWNSGTWTARVRFWAINRYDADAALIAPSLEARSPLLAAIAESAPGKLLPTQRGLELSRKGVQVTAFGANPDGEGTVLRLWELAGKSGSCQVRLPVGVDAKSVQPADLRGCPVGKPIAVRNGAFTVSLKAFAPSSFVLQTPAKKQP